MNNAANEPDYTISEESAVESDVRRLAELKPLEYDQCRVAEAKRLRVRVSTLDTQVVAARGGDTGRESKALQGRPLELKSHAAWPSSVNGAELLRDLVKFFSEHLSLPPGGAILLAFWSIHTHCFESFRHSPRLAVRSPEKGCGKTTVLDMLEMVCARPLPTASVTAAAIFRSVEAAKPTLLIDEADTFLAASDELRGILNAGHKSGGQVIRCVGDDAEPRAFAAFAPAAVAAIGTLPGTIQDRALTLMMRRAIGSELPKCIGPETETRGRDLASRAVRWLADNAGALKIPPVMPAGVTNRRADNWRPILAIASVAGGEWPGKAAALASAQSGEDDGMGLLAMLLADLQAIFVETGAERLATGDLVNHLVAREDRPWPEMPGTNRPMTAARLTRMIKPVGAERKQWRPSGTENRVWGFHKDDLADAFARYATNTPAKTGEVVTAPIKTGKNENSNSDKPNASPLRTGDKPAAAATLSPPCTGDTGLPSPVEDSATNCKSSTVTKSPDFGGGAGGKDNGLCRWQAEI